MSNAASGAASRAAALDWAIAGQHPHRREVERSPLHRSLWIALGPQRGARLGNSPMICFVQQKAVWSRPAGPNAGSRARPLSAH